MARTKPMPHRSPGVNHENPRNLARAPISTDWTSARLRTHKSKRQRELEEAFRILGAGLNDPGAVTARELAWAKDYARKEQELEDAENETVSADSDGAVFEEQDEDENNDSGEEGDEGAEILSGSISSSENHRSAPLTANNLASFDLEDEDAISATSSLSSVSNISALEPEDSTARPTVAPSSTHSDQTSTAAEPETTISPLESRLQHALNTLQYDDNPPDRPHWLTGLPKPLAHPDLTDLENLEVENRFWNDEITRLTKLRRDLPVNPVAASSTSAADKKIARKKHDAKGKRKAVSNREDNGEEDGGEWYFNHFNRTEPVIKVHRKRRTTVFARGIWEFKTSPDHEVAYRVLDEWPLTEEGEMLGWGAVSGEDNQVVDVEMVGDGREGGFGVWEVGEESVINEVEGEGGEEVLFEMGGEEVLFEMGGDGEEGEENGAENGGDDGVWEDMEE
ncbi:hypothetical protein FB567DRAFT_574395 [Paraphoma chrysanthemicola]|uniref:Uncharacterized protein n=1 Tax=Paraphoma chrysanthemicola TaxID=798071 RepID=A0A8K0RGF2_9PLEO|nr:hypothetical protein FB567DRAFT_574395 [Paraphoma chrysanthemicola]